MKSLQAFLTQLLISVSILTLNFNSTMFAADYELLYTMHGYTGLPQFLRICNEQGYILAGSFPYNFKFIQYENNDIINAFRLQSQSNYANRLGANAKYACLNRIDSSMLFQIVDLFNRNIIYSKMINIRFPKTSLINSSLTMIALVDQNNKIIIIDTSGKELDKPLDNESIETYHIDMSANSKYLAGISKQFYFIYDIEQKSLIRRDSIQFNDFNWRIKIAPDMDKLLIFNKNEKNILIRSIKDELYSKTVTSSINPTTVEISDDGKELVAMGTDLIMKYDVDKNTETQINSFTRANIDNIYSFGKYITYNGQINIYEFPSNQLITSFKVHIGLSDFSITDDNNYLVSFESNRTQIRDLQSGNIIRDSIQSSYVFDSKYKLFHTIKDSSESVSLDMLTLDTIERFVLPLKSQGVYISPNHKYFGLIPIEDIYQRKIYDIETNKLLYSSDSSLGSYFSPSEKFIYGWDGRNIDSLKYVVKEFPTGNIVFDFTDEALKRYFPTFSDDDEFVFIRKDSLIEKYSNKGQALEKSFKIPMTVIGDNYHLFEDKDMIMTAMGTFQANYGDIIIRGITDNMVYEKIKGFNVAASKMKLSNNKEYLAVIYSDGTLRVYRMPSFIWNSTEEENRSERLTIFPNPVNNQLQVSMGNTLLPNSIKLTNQHGIIQQEIFNISENHLTLDVSEYTAGLYFVVMEFPDGTRLVEKFIKIGE